MKVEISENPVEMECIDSIEAGDEIIFKGIVRGFDSHQVKGLYYEVEENMAKREMEIIARETIEKFGVLDCCIFHRKGFVKSGDITMIVRVKSRHRKEGFDALIYCVDNIKHRVPIWKKEITDNTERWL